MDSMEKDLRISLLFDFYGDMLTEKQQEVIEYYYNQDLSLAEIAQHSGISRQGVRDSIKRAERQLLHYEEKLGFLEKFHHIQEGLEDIRERCILLQDDNRRKGGDLSVERQLREIVEIATQLTDD